MRGCGLGGWVWKVGYWFQFLWAVGLDILMEWITESRLGSETKGKRPYTTKYGKGERKRENCDGLTARMDSSLLNHSSGKSPLRYVPHSPWAKWIKVYGARVTSWLEKAKGEEIGWNELGLNPLFLFSLLFFDLVFGLYWIRWKRAKLGQRVKWMKWVKGSKGM